VHDLIGPRRIDVAAEHRLILVRHGEHRQQTLEGRKIPIVQGCRDRLLHQMVARDESRLAFPLIVYLPTVAAQWAALNLKNALIINVVLAIFNLFPLPPLDGGRIVVGLLPNVLAKKFARIEPYGLMILIGLLIILPLLGSQLGMNLNFVSYLISVATNAVIQTILRLTGNI
jgi:hypothetical protein